ncbi:unnamed protein product [Rotaria sp. Silwood2]|nr:unnamed protein product [Rotaria sp. Silwood2]
MPKRTEGSVNFSQSIDYDDSDSDGNENEDNISDNDYEVEKSNKIHENLPSLSQILIVARLLGKREFILCRNGTKKFFNKVRQYRELSQFDKSNDVNFGSRMGKAAEILCKLAAIAEILRIAIEILQILRAQNQLHYDDTSLVFIRNATSLIERKYSSSNIVLEIHSSSCRIAGQLVCSHLVKMLFALYNIEPNDLVHSTVPTIRQRIIQMPQLFFLKRELTGSMGLLRHFPTDLVNTVIDELVNYQLIRRGPYIRTTSRGIVHMKSFPSDNILNDPIKRNMINQLLTEIKMDLTSYMIILCNSSIKDKQILTTNGIQMLLLPEHKQLYENLKKNYPNHNFDMYIHFLKEKTAVITNENVPNHNVFPLPNFLNQLCTQLHANTNMNQFSNMSLCGNINAISSINNNSNAIPNKSNINNDIFSTIELNNIVSLNTNETLSTCTQTSVVPTANSILIFKGAYQYIIHIL